MATTPRTRTRTTVSSVLRRAFAPYAMTTSVTLHGAGWVTTEVPPLPAPRAARTTPAVATRAPEARELATAGA